MGVAVTPSMVTVPDVPNREPVLSIVTTAGFQVTEPVAGVGVRRHSPFHGLAVIEIPGPA